MILWNIFSYMEYCTIVFITMSTMLFDSIANLDKNGSILYYLIRNTFLYRSIVLSIY